MREARDAWLVFEDEAGFTLTPPTTRTWARRGHTPWCTSVAAPGAACRSPPCSATNPVIPPD